MGRPPLLPPPLPPKISQSVSDPMRKPVLDLFGPGKCVLMFYRTWFDFWRPKSVFVTRFLIFLVIFVSKQFFGKICSENQGAAVSHIQVCWKNCCVTEGLWHMRRILDWQFAELTIFILIFPNLSDWRNYESIFFAFAAKNAEISVLMLTANPH